MRRDLTQPLRAGTWPQSLRTVPVSAENASAVHQLLMLGTELGGGRVPAFETWLSGFENDPEFDPRLCFVVHDPFGVAAVAQCWTSSFIRNLVVHPRAQGRGVALAVLRRVFEAFAERHERQVDLKVMESNLTARRVYERAGMQYVERCELEPR
ncbi:MULTISPECIES: GNAT family N-acetyltransferase [unclassified Pseudomonas]|uniref:GNAT family N-acetyltransferase n=1 Tax=unclassified Pseudomonas TaxID=196821 RepID=UPI0025EAB489|nr:MULTISPECIES: GNAT family N-acetyltransferase [unclassified Pseudomonas]